MRTLFRISSFLLFLYIVGIASFYCEAVVEGEGRDINKLTPQEKQDLHYAASKDYMAANEFLYKVGDRSEAAEKYLAIANKYQGTDISTSPSRLSAYLKIMSEEDKAFKEPKDITKLSEEEKINYYIYKIRDISAQSAFVPGKCQVLREGGRNNAAIELRKIGKPAVPALMALLNDERPTRSIAGGMNGMHVLRYCDAAVQIIEGIACRVFDNANEGRGSYFGNAAIETRKRIIAEVNKWWDNNKDKTESEWIREVLAEKGIGSYWLNIDGAKRLIELEGPKSADFFRERLKKEPDESWVISLLLEAGGKTVLEDIRPFLTSENRHVRMAAYRAFIDAGDKDVVKIIIKELDDMLAKPVERPDYFGSMAGLLAKSEDETGLRASAKLILHENKRIAEYASIFFYFALRDSDKPSIQFRKIVVPYMVMALDEQKTQYRALHWLVDSSETPVELSENPTKEQREKAIEQLKQWWAGHKSEYPAIHE